MDKQAKSPSFLPPSSLAERLSGIRAAMEATRASGPLAAGRVVLLAACKGQSVPVIREASGLGVSDFGENRVQEAEEKWASIDRTGLTLHLIGPLQSNKTKEALALFDVIQTLDRVKLADELAKHWTPSSHTRAFYIQVNTGKEPQKAGVLPEEADSFIEYCKTLGLPVIGLMCVPPEDQPAAPHFAFLCEVALRHGLTQLSMGMSEDFETAIRMGSTCVRVGRALFGERL